MGLCPGHLYRVLEPKDLQRGEMCSWPQTLPRQHEGSNSSRLTIRCSAATSLEKVLEKRTGTRGKLCVLDYRLKAAGRLLMTALGRLGTRQ